MSSDKMVSVIIPVYNAEKTVGACIESVRSQTYDNLEIILVDDCSSDNSYNICKNYEIKDSRIRVLKQDVNKGVSEARNTGIGCSTGDFIAFVDSDDTIEPDMYQKMVNSLLMNNADICICQFRLRDQVDGATRSIVDNSYAGVYDDSYEMIRILYDETSAHYKDTLIQSVLNKIYRCELFDQISFSGRFGEDCFVNNQIYSKQCKVVIIENEFYNYYYTSNAESLSHTVTNKQRMIFLEIFNSRIELYNDQLIRFETMKRYCDLYLMFLNSEDYEIVKQDNY